MPERQCKGCEYCSLEKIEYTSVVGMCRWGGINFGWLFDLLIQPWCPVNRDLPVKGTNEQSQQGDTHEC